MFPSVSVQHEIHESAHEPRAFAAKDDEPGAADLGTALEIDESEPATDLPMRRDPCAFTRRAPRSDDGVSLFSPGGNLIERDVGQLEQNRRELALRRRQFLVQSRDLVSEGPRPRLQILG